MHTAAALYRCPSPLLRPSQGSYGECDSAAGGKGREDEEWRDTERERS